MTEIEINRYKGLLAELLGFEIAERTTWHFFGVRTEYHYLLVQPYGSDNNFDSTKQYYSIDDLNKSLRFNTSWDWMLAAYKQMKFVELSGNYSNRLRACFIADMKEGGFRILVDMYEELRERGAVKSILEKRKQERNESRVKK